MLEAPAGTARPGSARQLGGDLPDHVGPLGQRLRLHPSRTWSKPRHGRLLRPAPTAARLSASSKLLLASSAAERSSRRHRYAVRAAAPVLVAASSGSSTADADRLHHPATRRQAGSPRPAPAGCPAVRRARRGRSGCPAPAAARVGVAVVDAVLARSRPRHGRRRWPPGQFAERLAGPAQAGLPCLGEDTSQGQYPRQFPSILWFLRLLHKYCPFKGCRTAG